MGLNIKSERVHALAKELAALRGKSMTAVIEDALEHAIRRTKAEDDAAELERIKAHDKLMALLRTSPDLPVGCTSDHSDLYDEDGLPI